MTLNCASTWIKKIVETVSAKLNSLKEKKQKTKRKQTTSQTNKTDCGYALRINPVTDKPVLLECKIAL